MGECHRRASGAKGAQSSQAFWRNGNVSDRSAPNATVAAGAAQSGAAVLARLIDSDASSLKRSGCDGYRDR